MSWGWTLFDVFDPESPDGRVYRALITRPRATIGSLAERTELPEESVRQILTGLHASAIAIPLDADEKTWDAVRPDIIVADTLRRQEEQRARVYQSEAGLMELYHFARRESSDFVQMELIEGPDAVFSRFRTIQNAVRTHVRAIDRPPYYWDADEIARQEKLQCEQMASGISYQTIYQESASDSPARSASMMRTVACGENARVLADPPIKLTIADDQIALLAADPPPGAEGSLIMLLVHPSPLLDALINVFESLWRLAVPINLARLNQGLSDRDQAILTLMASGATDEAIARRLGVSRRTVIRSVAKLLEQLGASTRFQAGAQAARRGWL